MLQEYAYAAVGICGLAITGSAFGLGWIFSRVGMIHRDDVPTLKELDAVRRDRDHWCGEYSRLAAATTSDAVTIVNLRAKVEEQARDLAKFRRARDPKTGRIVGKVA